MFQIPSTGVGGARTCWTAPPHSLWLLATRSSQLMLGAEERTPTKRASCFDYEGGVKEGG